MRSVQVSHFPESILVQLYERHALRDYFVAQVGRGERAICGCGRVLQEQPRVAGLGFGFRG